MASTSVSVQLPVQPFDVSFHPTERLLASALISGAVELTSFSQSGDASPARMWRKKGHNKACRAVAFVEDGASLVSASSDCGLVLRDTETGQRIRTTPKAHDAAVNRLSAMSESTIASADDDGVLKLWDVRRPTCTATCRLHDDYVSDLVCVPALNRVLSVSGEGTLAVYDARLNKREAKSQYAEDELLSVMVVKNGRKVVCGSQDGVLLLYSWGYFNDCSDRMPGHPESVDTLVKLNEDTVITGCADGSIRLVSILPNSFCGFLAHLRSPIEKLAISSDASFLACATHDNSVTLWDMAAVQAQRNGAARPTEDGTEKEEEEGAEAEGSEGEERGAGGREGRRAGGTEGAAEEIGRRRRRDGEQVEREGNDVGEAGAGGEGGAEEDTEGEAEEGGGRGGRGGGGGSGTESSDSDTQAKKQRCSQPRKKQKHKKAGSVVHARKSQFFKDL